MRIQLLSDLHLEFRTFQFEQHPDADVVVLAGDLMPLTYSTVEVLYRLFDRITVPVVVVLGNHDLYSPQSLLDHRTLHSSWHERFYRDLPNVHLLQNRHVVINDVCFVGTPLWTNFELYGAPLAARQAAQAGIADFGLISVDEPGSPRRIHTADMILGHRSARIAIGEALTQALPVVAVSHWLPSPQCITPAFRIPAALPLNPYFASHCEDLMRGPMVAWLYGHTHSPSDLLINGVRVVANPRGYTPRENPAFNPRFLIEI